MAERVPEFRAGDQVLANTRRGLIRAIVARIDIEDRFHLFAFDDRVNLGLHNRERIIRKLESIFTD